MSLASTLKSLRKKKKYTLRQLASLAGVNFTYLSKLENDEEGEITPRPEILDKLSDALDVSAIHLFLLAKRLPEEFALNKDLQMFLEKVNMLTPQHWHLIHQITHSHNVQPFTPGRFDAVSATPQVRAQLTDKRHFVYKNSTQTLQYSLSLTAQKNMEFYKLRGKIYLLNKEQNTFPDAADVTFLDRTNKSTLNSDINRLGNFHLSQIKSGEYLAIFTIGEVTEICEVVI